MAGGWHRLGDGHRVLEAHGVPLPVSHLRTGPHMGVGLLSKGDAAIQTSAAQRDRHAPRSSRTAPSQFLPSPAPSSSLSPCRPSWASWRRCGPTVLATAASRPARPRERFSSPGGSSSGQVYLLTEISLHTKSGPRDEEDVYLIYPPTLDDIHHTRPIFLYKPAIVTKRGGTARARTLQGRPLGLSGLSSHSHALRRPAWCRPLRQEPAS